MKSREDEKKRYELAYQSPKYRMGKGRMRATKSLFDLLGPGRGRKLLDVGCGRGEMLNYAEQAGFKVLGLEPVENVSGRHRMVQGDACNIQLPDKSVDVACLLDVMEHLVPGDDELACRELARVARETVLITLSNNDSWCPVTKQQMHINKRPYAEWHALFCTWFKGDVIWAPVDVIPRRHRGNPDAVKMKAEMFWQINLA